MLAPLAYLQWYRNRSSIDHDLGGTDLRSGAPDRSRLVPEPLSDVEDPPDGEGPTSILAAEYDVAQRNVVLASGARHAHLLAVMAALGAADGEPAALVETPAFEPLFETPAGLGARVDRFERPAPGFALDPARVEAAMTPETASVTVTNRHNPSGYRSDEGELAAVAEAAADRGAVLISNEVYAPYGTDGGEGPFGGPTAAGLPNAIAIGSLTKFTTRSGPYSSTTPASTSASFSGPRAILAAPSIDGRAPHSGTGLPHPGHSRTTRSRSNWTSQDSTAASIPSHPQEHRSRTFGWSKLLSTHGPSGISRGSSAR